MNNHNQNQPTPPPTPNSSLLSHYSSFCKTIRHAILLTIWTQISIIISVALFVVPCKNYNLCQYAPFLDIIKLFVLFSIVPLFIITIIFWIKIRKHSFLRQAKSIFLSQSHPPTNPESPLIDQYRNFRKTLKKTIRISIWATTTTTVFLYYPAYLVKATASVTDPATT